jgi:uncharacterized protein (DUF2147 family)
VSRILYKITAIASVAFTALPTGAATPPSIFGSWRTDDGAAIIDISHCGPALCGKIIKILDPNAPANDINNPDPKKRAQPLVNTLILDHFVGSGAVWKNGSAYDPKAGRSYRASLDLVSQDRLKVTGCIAFLCRSRFWLRATK